jgi:hypothetical protein
MAHNTPSSTVMKVRQEAALFDSKDRLLHFSTKNEFQTPLLREASDAFYEKWKQSSSAIPLDSFIPESATFTLQQKKQCETLFKAVFKEKAEDFGTPDLYLLAGFLKWDGNALAPSLLIPLEPSADGNSISLAKKLPLENIVLRERLAGVQLPRIEDATLDGSFSIQLYFSLFEKAIAAERNWKFTRHGICLAFINTSRLRLKMAMDNLGSEKKIDNNPFLSSLFGEDGFQVRESVFEEADFDQLYNPTDHHFLYTTDSHTTKVTIDALDENAHGYAIQALPGTQKTKVAANIVAETLSKGQSTLVVTRRAISRQTFAQAWKSDFRSYSGRPREEVAAEINKTRQFFINYYKAVNGKSPSNSTGLTDILQFFAQAPKPKAKFAETIFQESNALPFKELNQLLQLLQQITDLYFNKGGIAARKLLENIKAENITDQTKAEIEKTIDDAIQKVEALKPLIDLFKEEEFFPTGIYLPALSEIISLIHKNFDESTPEFEGWDLCSNSWSAYQDSLKELPEAGDKWVRYRRQTSDIYTDDAVDENILAARDDFAESLKVTLKGLSDRYRNSRKRLMKVLKHPKEVSSDAHLLDLVDTLLELQENKRAYKDTAVLGNHLLGRDWLYEKSNWVSLNKKINYIYDFREKHEKSPQFNLMLTILEHWHQIKPLLPQFNEFDKAVQELLTDTRMLSKELALEIPLEGLDLDKCLEQINLWKENWSVLDTHLQLATLFREVEKTGCKTLLRYVQNPASVNSELPLATAYYWAGTQVQRVNKEFPEIFSCTPKLHSQLGKKYRVLLDEFCNANFREAHAAATEKLSMLSIEDALACEKKFDTIVLLDADCISVAESIPLSLMASKVVLIGNPHSPAIEPQPFDAYLDTEPVHTAFFQESIMTASLRRGIPTRELWFSDSYSDVSLVEFANERIYNHGIRQLPIPTRDSGKCDSIQIVTDKVMDIAKAALHHAEKHPGQTLGIIAFHQITCHEIESTIKALLTKDSPCARFFANRDAATGFYIKTPERASEKYRDVVFVCAEPDAMDKTIGESKIAICSTLARHKLKIYMTEADRQKMASAKSATLRDWMSHLQRKAPPSDFDTKPADSALRAQVIALLQNEGINVLPSFAAGGIPVGPVVVDANNPKRFLAVIEDDCTTERFRESIEDREYVRPVLLRQLGWKVINLWTPFWYISYADESSHIITTIAIEQSVAPPPPEESETDAEAVESNAAATEVQTVPYQVVHPKIEGTAHDKPIVELSALSLIVQLKFYVDHEAPIHEDVLLSRLLELHHVDRAGPMILQALNDAIKQGFQRHKFIKTGKFFYSTKNPPVLLRDRSMRPQNERKFIYVSPEERALLPASMDEFAQKQALGLLE